MQAWADHLDGLRSTHRDSIINDKAISPEHGTTRTQNEASDRYHRHERRENRDGRESQLELF